MRERVFVGDAAQGKEGKISWFLPSFLPHYLTPVPGTGTLLEDN